MLKSGDKVYRPAWNEDNTPFVWEEEIINFKYRTDGSVRTYITNKGGFSENSIGRNVYLTEGEVFAKHKQIAEEYPNGMPKAVTSHCIR